MILHFCEKCGNRVPQRQIDSGEAVVTEETTAVCAGCAGKRLSRRTSQLQIPPASATHVARKSDAHAVPPGKRSGIHAVTSATMGPATHKSSTSGHLARPFNETADVQDGPGRKRIYIGGGVAVVLVILAVVLLSLGPGEKPRVPEGQPAKAPVALSPSTKPVAARPTDVVSGVKPASPIEPSVPTKTADGYDPRAAVAASALAEAKARAETDPWTYRDLLENLKERYARTPEAEEALKLLAEWKAPPQVTPPGQDKPRLDGSTDTVLTLADAYLWRCGYTGKPRENASIEGKPLRIGKKTFDQGIGLHAVAELNYDLGGYYRWLSGYVGIDAETGRRGSTRFEFWLDGRKAHETGVLRGNGEACFFTLAVDGVRRVRIVINGGDDGPGWDHADVCRLRVSVGAEEPRDDYAGGAANVATAVTPTTPEPKPEPKPEPEKPEPPALDAATLARQAYAQFVTGFWAVLGEKGWTVARSRLADARKAPQLAAYAGDLELDGVLLALAEKAWASIPAGAVKLKDGRAIRLTQDDGKFFELGPGARTRVLNVADSVIEIERDEGRGGKLVLKVACAKLTFPCKLELARFGLPDDGEGKLALVLMDWLHSEGRTVEGTDARVRKALDAAAAAKAPEASVARLRAWLDLFAKERAAERALSELERLIVEQKRKEALDAFEALKKDHVETACWVGLQPALPGLEQKLLPFRMAPMLWVSYWSGIRGNPFKTFHLARAETSLVRNMGGGSGDPSVPGDDFGLRMGGYLRIPAEGKYAFFSHSDDGLKVWLDGKLVTETMLSDKTAELELEPGLHAFKAEFIEMGGGATMVFRWKPPGATGWQPIPPELLQHIPDCKDEYQKP